MIHVEIPIRGHNLVVSARDLWVLDYNIVFQKKHTRNLRRYVSSVLCSRKSTYGEKRKRTRTGIHRLILGTPPHLVCHHINGDVLDNTRENLLECTQAEHVTLHLDTILSSRIKGGNYERVTI